MTLATGLMAFGILWWMVFFVVLPFGIKTEEESGGTTITGNAPSAPTRPRMLLKTAITTIITMVLFLAGYLAANSGIIDLRGYFSGAG